MKKIVKNSDVVHFTKVTRKLLDDYDAIILSGSHLSDREDIKNRLHHYQWVKSVDKPMLGICAGHQIIGEIFGAKRFHKKEDAEGYYHIYIDERGPILKGIRSDFRVFERHTDSINLPRGFILLGHSRVCDVEVMRHKSKPIYGVQFHPERSKKRVLENFVDIVKPVKT
ncbi:MAG: hypothetical protein GTN38_04930 [Candidatus Aenigmarchaeota archaeon]|nr:hypothetical protein [Candidatus Aenigmarchaeota archaeon]